MNTHPLDFFSDSDSQKKRYLELEIRRLQIENKTLRAALKLNGRHARRIRRAADCALLLATWHVAHLPTTRAFAAGQGMAQRQWQNACALLKLARITDQRGRWLIHDLATISAKLDDATVGANAAPDAYFAYGNRSMQG